MIEQKQAEVLKRLVQGEQWWCGSNIALHYEDTIMTLLAGGYMNWQPIDSWRSKYIVTKAGRTALMEYQDVK